MTVKCAPCKKEFCNETAYNQHVLSQGHALRRLVNQLDVDQKLAAKAPEPRQTPSSLQSHPGRPKISASQSDPMGKERRCIPCNKSFKDKAALNQHRGNSRKHAATVLRLRPAGNNTVKTKSRVSSLQEAPKPQPSPVDDIASKSEQSHSANQEEKENIAQNGSWSMLADCEHEALLQELSTHCHSPEDLTPNGNPRLASSQTAGQGRVWRSHEFRNVQHPAKFRNFTPSPVASAESRKSSAIVLDCEMALVKGSMGLTNEVIQVCAVDYFTGTVLLNRLVQPSGQVRAWNTKIHGITPIAMEQAVFQGHALAGWREAQTEMWKLVDQDTILIGHALQNDLDVLKMVHTRVVDTAILARNAVGTRGPHWGLQRLCKDLLGLEIRDNRGGVHDCMEDVFATREVALWCLRNKPELTIWAEAQKQKWEQEEEQRKAARLLEKARKRAEEEKRTAGLTLDSGSVPDTATHDHV